MYFVLLDIGKVYGYPLAGKALLRILAVYLYAAYLAGFIHRVYFKLILLAYSAGNKCACNYGAESGYGECPVYGQPGYGVYVLGGDLLLCHVLDQAHQVVQTRPGDAGNLRHGRAFAEAALQLLPYVLLYHL